MSSVGVQNERHARVHRRHARIRARRHHRILVTAVDAADEDDRHARNREHVLLFDRAAGVLADARLRAA